MALPKWTEERTEELVNFVGDESPISQATVAEAAEHFQTSARSVSSKLRKMEYEVATAASSKTSAFSPEATEKLQQLLENNSGLFTFAEIAERLGGGYTAKQVQGKVLSLQLNAHVRPTPKAEVPRSYTEEEEARFITLVNEGASIEALAEAFGREIPSVRGKALSLLRSGVIEAIPKQESTKGAEKVDPLEALGPDVAEMTVTDIAEALDKTPRGVKTMLTRRGISVSDYDGAAKKAKASA